MLSSINLPTKFRKVIQDIGGSAGLDLVDPSIFSEPRELTSANKAGVLQERRCFTETPVDSRKCVSVICKILYLTMRGVEFTQTEKTDIFFASTRLFQCTSSHLRRMVYLLIKTIQPSHEEAFVVTSSLTKDVGCSNDLFRANAFRAIVRVVDPHTASQLDRFFKAAIVDRNPHVASSAILCGIHLAKSAPELVRRWVNEVQECVSSRNPMVQFHALVLLYELRKNDRLALHRVIASLTARVTKSPLAECLLIRYATRLLAQPGESALDKSLYEFLEQSLQHRTEIVTFEAARAILTLGLESPKFNGPNPPADFDVSGAITALQILLSNVRSVVRYAAVRVLYKVAQSKPQWVSRCVADIKPLITDPCRAVAVLALITMLKSAQEGEVDKLIRKVSDVMMGCDISESQRVEVVVALRSLCVAYPLRMHTIAGFLAQQLREKGGSRSKTYSVDTLCFLARENSAIHEMILLQLADFIEDCAYSCLCCHVIAFLTTEIPKTRHPRKFLRFIYNRAILENPAVRGAAVDSLLRIAVQCPAVRDDVITMFQTGLDLDTEDEVRERVRAAMHILSREKRAGDDLSTTASEPPSVEDLLVQSFDVKEQPFEFSLEALVDNLSTHIANGKENVPFDLGTLPTEEAYNAQKAREMAELAEEERAALLAAAGETTRAAAPKPAVPEVSYDHVIRTALAPKGIDLGRVHHETSPAYLTEREAEYVVQVVKHFWTNTKWLSMELVVRNTVEKQTLCDVALRLDLPANCPFKVTEQTLIPTLEFDQEKSLYVLLERVEGEQQEMGVTCSMTAQLDFLVKEDVDDLGETDHYKLMPITISSGEYICPVRLTQQEVVNQWNAVGDDNQTVIKMNFGHIRGGLTVAAEKFVSQFNMYKAEVKDPVTGEVAQNKVCLVGRAVGSPDIILIRAELVESSHGVLGKVLVRSASKELAARLVSTALRNE